MFHCDNCGRDFEELKNEKEEMGEHFGFLAYESFNVCPCCGSDNWVESKECKICGAEFYPEYGYQEECEECEKGEVRHGEIYR